MCLYLSRIFFFSSWMQNWPSICCHDDYFFLHFGAFVVVPSEPWECATTFGVTMTTGVGLLLVKQGIFLSIHFIFFLMNMFHLHVCAFTSLRTLSHHSNYSEASNCIEKLFWKLLLEARQAPNWVDFPFYQPVRCKKLFCCGSTFWWSYLKSENKWVK